MFVEAIEAAAQFTRPICTISRAFGTTTPIPGTGTLFLVNSEGWALTCAHVAEVLVTAPQINIKYEQFKQEKRAIPEGKRYRRDLDLLEAKYGYNRDRPAQIMPNFVNCVDRITDFTVHIHDKYDIA